jgi:hypothetical protein
MVRVRTGFMTGNSLLAASENSTCTVQVLVLVAIECVVICQWVLAMESPSAAGVSQGNPVGYH